MTVISYKNLIIWRRLIYYDLSPLREIAFLFTSMGSYSLFRFA